jgi:hypothetical protein
MRRATGSSIAVAVFCAQLAWPQGASWNKLRYQGGTVEAKTSRFDFNATLTVTDDSIVLVFAPRMTVRLEPSQVTSLSSGAAARRRVAEFAASGAPAQPPALFGLLRGNEEGLIGITYLGDDGKAGAVLLEALRAQHWLIMQVLKAVTGKPINAPP